MGMEDREWYRDIHRERAGLKPKHQRLRNKLDISNRERDNPYFVESSRSSPLQQGVSFFSKPAKPRSWHPVLQILLFVAICTVTFLLLRFFKR